MQAPSPVAWAAGAATLLASVLVAALGGPTWIAWTLAVAGLGGLGLLFWRSQPFAEARPGLLLERVVSPGLPVAQGSAPHPSDGAIVAAVTGRRPRPSGTPAYPTASTRTASLAVQAQAVELPQEPPLPAVVTVGDPAPRMGRGPRPSRRPAALVDAEVDAALARRAPRKARAPRTATRPARATRSRTHRAAPVAPRAPARRRTRTLRH